MNTTKDKLGRNEPVLGGWLMTGSAAVAEIMTAAGFDFLGVDMEHTATGLEDFHRIALAAKGSGCDLLARLPSCDPVLAKKVLDLGAAGIIVPSVNSPEEAAQSVAMARFPPEGIRGASLCRATGYGTDFAGYFHAHNRNVVVVVMLEHIRAVERADEILAVPGIDAALIGPYDLSASMNLAGRLDHPDVQTAQRAVLEACRRHHVAAGIHVVPVDPDEVRRRIDAGYRFIPCGIDTLFVREGCRRMLAARK
jgi:2-dehydro-3-deoxyglucarate aldolase